MLCRCWGVKTVSEIYVGVGGSPQKVWPSYTDYGGDDISLTSSLEICQYSYGYCIDYAYNSGYSHRGSVWGYTNSSSGRRAVCREGMHSTTTFSTSGNVHWYSVGPMDTRGYNYILVHFSCGNYSSDRRIYYGIPIFGYNSTHSDNPYYGGHYITGSVTNFGTATSDKGYDTDYSYFLFDFTNINLESTYLQLGLQIGVSSDDNFPYYSCVHGGATMHKSKPSDSVSQTLTF